MFAVLNITMVSPFRRARLMLRHTSGFFYALSFAIDIYIVSKYMI